MAFIGGTFTIIPGVRLGSGYPGVVWMRESAVSCPPAAFSKNTSRNVSPEILYLNTKNLRIKLEPVPFLLSFQYVVSNFEQLHDTDSNYLYVIHLPSPNALSLIPHPVKLIRNVSCSLICSRLRLTQPALPRNATTHLRSAPDHRHWTPIRCPTKKVVIPTLRTSSNSPARNLPFLLRPGLSESSKYPNLLQLPRDRGTRNNLTQVLRATPPRCIALTRPYSSARATHPSLLHRTPLTLVSHRPPPILTPASANISAPTPHFSGSTTRAAISIRPCFAKLSDLRPTPKTQSSAQQLRRSPPRETLSTSPGSLSPLFHTPPPGARPRHACGNFVVQHAFCGPDLPTANPLGTLSPCPTPESLAQDAHPPSPRRKLVTARKSKQAELFHSLKHRGIHCRYLPIHSPARSLS
ncbi:hypothetical protein GOBAR_AA09324 [Gossypium barbadense]|uniref:Uncharacterized protein n=1 Tax=Gossypium barbadense TaxID=3634 RepID=A0A2P5Y6Y0_GOSBA|nr:hypothetical protein GOBAR_AA09324 [Gossypium barbadense]